MPHLDVSTDLPAARVRELLAAHDETVEVAAAARWFLLLSGGAGHDLLQHPDPGELLEVVTELYDYDYAPQSCPGCTQLLLADYGEADVDAEQDHAAGLAALVERMLGEWPEETAEATRAELAARTPDARADLLADLASEVPDLHARLWAADADHMREHLRQDCHVEAHHAEDGTAPQVGYGGNRNLADLARATLDG